MDAQIVSLIDHAVLHPTHTDNDVRAGCALAIRLGVASVCVKPCHVPLAAELLAGCAVVPSTVIGFPSGGTSRSAKSAETSIACREGAREVDMVVNLGKALSGDLQFVRDDIRGVVDAAAAQDAIVKVILETGILADDDLKIRLCEAAEAAGAAFVKTSTGFGFAKGADGVLRATGATEHDIQLMRAACSDRVQIKASGGIRTYRDAKRFAELGCTRLGTSSSEAIAAGEQDASMAAVTDY